MRLVEKASRLRRVCGRDARGPSKSLDPLPANHFQQISERQSERQRLPLPKLAAS